MGSMPEIVETPCSLSIMGQENALLMSKSAPKSQELFLMGCFRLSSMNSNLFLVRLLWEFDMELDPASSGWANQKGFMGPYRTPLLVKIKRRNVTDRES
jgi:hypothetical protein